ncbi:MAG: hypothetical protein L0Y64_14855, partial [Myxococcaceae bacterium]|nr:hypothetical protein [Myxococcaceae bacterium]
NGLLTVLLTYPAWAVLPGCARVLQHALRESGGMEGIDIGGKLEALQQVLRLLPYIARHRDAATTTQLLRFLRLGRQAEAL